MTISFSLPPELEAALTREFGDLGVAAQEAFVIEGYRRGRLSLGLVTRVLALDTSIQSQEWLAKHGVPLNYDTGDLETDRRTLSSIFKNAP
jgi:predicted HTH domain antitoxin